MSSLLMGAALGATGAFMLDPEAGPRRRARVRSTVDDLRRRRTHGLALGAGAASILYAFARGGFGALVPLALGVALVACSQSMRRQD